MARKVTLTLTQAEAAELFLVAGNGYGDGDFYGLNHDGMKGNRRGLNIYRRAIDKLQVAREIARGDR